MLGRTVGGGFTNYVKTFVCSFVRFTAIIDVSSKPRDRKGKKRKKEKERSIVKKFFLAGP